MDKFVIIVAGGSGNRMSAEVPKQFLLLSGKPLLMHSIEKFHAAFTDITIIIALNPAFKDAWKGLCEQYKMSIKHQLVEGGETRYHSVKNALHIVPGDCLVAVHDAARPLVSILLIKETFDAAVDFGSAIPCIPVNETIRMISQDKISLIDRNTLRIVQTPQVFNASLLKKAYEQDFDPQFTDDGSLLEAMGLQVNLVKGDPSNIKVTLPDDLKIAEVLIKNNT
jgi:2-C-methyl-D-erythritol 4-phosphate cytidylyltransferase